MNLDMGRTRFDLTEAPVMNFEEYDWMFRRLEESGDSFLVATKVDARRGNLELRPERTATGWNVRTRRCATTSPER